MDFTSSQGSTWEKLAGELKDYGSKIDAAKSQFDDLSVNIDDFTKQLEEAAARERKITEMLNSFMAKIDNVSQQNWDPTMSQQSQQPRSPPKLLATPAWKSSPPLSSSLTTSQAYQSSTPNSIHSPMRSTDLSGASRNIGSPQQQQQQQQLQQQQQQQQQYISSSEAADGGPQVHISRHGSISIMQPPK